MSLCLCLWFCVSGSVCVRVRVSCARARARARARELCLWQPVRPVSHLRVHLSCPIVKRARAVHNSAVTLQCFCTTSNCWGNYEMLGHMCPHRPHLTRADATGYSVMDRSGIYTVQRSTPSRLLRGPLTERTPHSLLASTLAPPVLQPRDASSAAPLPTPDRASERATAGYSRCRRSTARKCIAAAGRNQLQVGIQGARDMHAAGHPRLLG